MDYGAFVSYIVSQAEKNAPEDMNIFQKKFLCTQIDEYATIAAKNILNSQDEDLMEHWEVITQMVAEWIFYKCTDLIRSGIPQKYWEAVLQKVAFTVYECARQSLQRNLSEKEMNSIAETYVYQAYCESISELFEDGLIDVKTKDTALYRLDIDTLPEQYDEQQENNKFSLLYKILSVLYFIFACMFIITVTPQASYNILFGAIVYNLVGVYAIYANGILKTRQQAGLTAILVCGYILINYFTANRAIVMALAMLLFGCVMVAYFKCKSDD